MDTEELKNNPFLPKGLYYWFDLAEDKDFTKMFKQDTILRDTSIFVGNLKVGQTYHWRTKAYHEMGYGPFGVTNSLTISSTSSVQEDVLRSGITMSSIDGGLLLTSAQEEMEITIFTIDGRSLGSVKAQGKHFIPCDQQGMNYALIRLRNAHHMIPINCIK